ncbi:MAG: hypothetical protein AB1489_41730 [Acidobacteriota bacterium]
MEDVIVINTSDTVLVISKNAVRSMKLLLDELERKGYKNIL